MLPETEHIHSSTPVMEKLTYNTQNDLRDKAHPSLNCSQAQNGFQDMKNGIQSFTDGVTKIQIRTRRLAQEQMWTKYSLRHAEW